MGKQVMAGRCYSFGLESQLLLFVHTAHWKQVVGLSAGLVFLEGQRWNPETQIYLNLKPGHVNAKHVKVHTGLD